VAENAQATRQAVADNATAVAVRRSSTATAVVEARSATATARAETRSATQTAIVQSVEATKQAKAAKTMADEEAYLSSAQRVIERGGVLFDTMRDGLENFEKFDDTEWFLTLAIIREGLADEVDRVRNQPPPTTR
jgi:hypothetical protein